MALLLGIYEGLKLLVKEDPHRVQCFRNLSTTLKYAKKFLETAGIAKDFEKIVASIENGGELDSSQFKHFEIPEEQKLKLASLVQEISEFKWSPILDDTLVHFQYQINLDRFKSQFKVTFFYWFNYLLQSWIQFHFKIVKKEFLTEEDITGVEKELGYDIRTCPQ